MPGEVLKMFEKVPNKICEKLRLIDKAPKVSSHPIIDTMFKINPFKSIYLKLFIPIIVPILVLFLYLHLIWQPIQLEIAQENFRVGQLHMIAALEPVIRESILGGGTQQLFITFESLLETIPAWVGIELYDHKEKRLYPADMPAAVFHPKLLRLEQVISFQGDTLGRFIVSANSAVVMNQELLRLQKIQNFFFIFLCLSGFLLYWLLSHFLLRPISQISKAALKLSQGDFTANLPKRVFKDEIGILIDSFSEMRDKYRGSQEVLNLKVSEYVLLVRKLELAKELAEISTEAKSDFLANMSHEIRTPMNGVLGMLGLLENTSLDPIQLHQVGIAKNSANSLLTLINDILDFSKIEAGKMELEYLPFNLSSELEQVVELMATQAKDKKISLILDTHQLTRNQVIGDPGRLRQIVTNLIANAIKFTAEGEVRVAVKIERLTEDQGRLHISVSDTGIGIDKLKIRTLFDTFTQADSSITRKYGGTGLGLSIAKKLSQVMGGSISITSKVDVGSVFSFDIIVGLGEDALVKTIVVTSANNFDKDHSWPSQTRILLVEDNPTNQMVAQRMLEIIGLSADIANNGLEALWSMEQALEFAPYTLILMDAQMPEMDGYAASTAIREGKAGEVYKTIPIIAMTANAMTGDREKCILSGMNDYISKPISILTLKTTLMKFLNTKENNMGETPPRLVVTTTNEIKKELKLLDLSVALVHYGGKQELLDIMIQSFGRDAMHMSTALHEAIMKDAFLDANFHAHSIKNLASYVGALKLQEIAERLELAAAKAEEENYEILKELYPLLVSTLNQTLEVLQVHIQKTVSTNIKELKQN